MPKHNRQSVKDPCSHCRRRHIKCDEGIPKCGRCQKKGLDCVRSRASSIFRHVHQSLTSRSRGPQRDIANASRLSSTSLLSLNDRHPSFGFSSNNGSPDITYSSLSPSRTDAFLTPSSGSTDHEVTARQTKSVSNCYTTTYAGASVDIQSQDVNHENVEPDDSTQEACLFRYFIEELAPWFDLCDDQRHFQLVIPMRARSCLPLRNAICAVAARHLHRQPQYRTPSQSDGLVYHGQHLRNLTEKTAVEYMLSCIPALHDFHEIHDIEYQENIMAAAVILRQYEEIEDDEVDVDNQDLGGYQIADAQYDRRVNFLAVIKTITESFVTSSTTQGLANAIFWISARQEIYYSLIRNHVPRMSFGPGKWRDSTHVNALIMYTADVTQWRLGDRSAEGWVRLTDQQREIRESFLVQIKPLLEKKPDRSKGEVFPTIWYSTDAEITGIQHFELARMILIAEDPNLSVVSNNKAAHRKAEAQVRSIILRLCGMALGRLGCAPALLNAVIGILLYGDYFVDPQEQQALKGVIERLQEVRAWPVQNRYRDLKKRWAFMNCE